MVKNDFRANPYKMRIETWIGQALEHAKYYISEQILIK